MNLQWKSETMTKEDIRKYLVWSPLQEKSVYKLNNEED